MAGKLRNFALAGVFLLAVVLIGVVLKSGLWAVTAASVLGIAGVVLFRGNRWRTGSLLAAALSLSLVMLDLVAGLLSPSAKNAGLVYTTDPKWWPPADPILGFRPQPDTKVLATATFDDTLVYRQTYNFDTAAARVTPAAPAGADTYLFMGDSFIFGQGLADGETLASQFAKLNGQRLHTANLGVPGYGPNHLVRAFEAGLVDRYKDTKVKAVVTWIIPAHLARVTGDGAWLGSSPRYVLENGKLRFTGTFNEHRWRDPLAGIRYLLGEEFAFVDAIGQKQRQDEQVELFVALIARLQVLARETFGVPLVIVYSWPDERTQRPYGSKQSHDLLVSIIGRIRHLGTPMLSVDSQTERFDVSRLLIPHDGHPNAFSNELIAEGLKRLLDRP
ncbi:MAG: hypothetical protein EPO67_16815 [Reyranella sp.]|jgi:hypothetical protein|nr:MAG: hypothetical protein EPO67_16815 [Reyranella sp.]